MRSELKQAYNRAYYLKNQNKLRQDALTYYHGNKDVILKRIQERFKANPDTRLHYEVKRFGITAKDYNTMLEAQSGVCAICAQAERAKSRSNKPKRLAVDHSAVTGKVRALLCSSCNQALGLLQEKAETVKAMLRYIEEHNA